MHFKITDGGGADLSAFVTVTEKASADHAALHDIRISKALKHVRIEWEEPMLDHVSVWHPTCGRNRGLPQFFHEQRTESCFYRGAPVLATVKADGRVHRAVALSDTEISSVLGYYVDDFNENDTVVFFIELNDVAAGFAAELRVSEKSEPLADALGEVWRWWNQTTAKALPLSEAAFEPLYSTWYNFHQTPDQTALTAELKLAAGLGFQTVILDDGWQIEGTGTKDYRKSGDWMVAPDKFPDFKGFVRNVHAFGQKLILWFAVPFAGFDTAAYRRFRSRLLFEDEGFLHAGTLDIRYPDVRAYLIDACLRYIKEYDIDGLKLDFIDHFQSRPALPAFCEEMDTPGVTQAVKLLLEELCREAVRLKPGFLIEFRQNYIGPGILRFANLLRVGDCAFDAATNRIGVTDLRLMTRNVAVHSDMLLFSPRETPENCALQLLNVMFAVPQISIRLAQAGEAQRKLLKTYLAYWRQNRDLLMNGRLSVRHPESGYSAVSAQDEQTRRRITVLYTESAWRADGWQEDVWNATGAETIAVINDSGKTLALTIYNCFGEPVRKLTSAEAAAVLTVPVGGCVNIWPKD